jgi:hypothetical protein
MLLKVVGTVDCPKLFLEWDRLRTTSEPIVCPEFNRVFLGEPVTTILAHNFVPSHEERVGSLDKGTPAFAEAAEGLRVLAFMLGPSGLPPAGVEHAVPE